MNIVAMVLAGGEGTRLLSAHRRARQAGGAFRERLPARGLRAEQPGELAHLDDLRARAVQARIADASTSRTPGRRGSRTATARSRCCCRAPIPSAASSRAPRTPCTSTWTCCRRTRPTWWRCSPPTTCTAWTCARWSRSTASGAPTSTVSAVAVPIEAGFALRHPGARSRRPGQRVPARSRKRRGADAVAIPTRAYASMGNYLFEPDSPGAARSRRRAARGETDFGRDILPRLCATRARVRLRLRREPRPGRAGPSRSRRTGATSARLRALAAAQQDAMGSGRASTSGTAAGRSAASTTPRCSASCAAGAEVARAERRRRRAWQAANRDRRSDERLPTS